MRHEADGGLPGVVIRADVRQRSTVPGAKERKEQIEGEKREI